MSLFIFGDSITFGMWDTAGGWANRLKKEIEKKIISTDFDYYNSVYVLGVPGNTTRDLLKRMETELRSRIQKDEKNVIILAIGINDSQNILKTGSFSTQIDRFTENVTKLITIAGSFAQHVVVVGLTPVDEAKINFIDSRLGWIFKNESIRIFDQILRTVSNQQQVYYLPVFDKFFNNNYRRLLLDGLHPNSAGHLFLFQIIRDYLIEKKLL